MTSNRLQCQICGKIGHSALKCFHRFNLQFNGASAYGSASGVMLPSSSSQAYLASPTTINDKAWLLDSGATHHVTTDDTSLDSKTEYTGSARPRLAVGN